MVSYSNQKLTRININSFLREQSEKTNPLRELTSEETKRLAKLEVIANKLKRGENVQNRQLKTWLSDDEYAQLEMEWEEQLELRSEPSEPSEPIFSLHVILSI
jgi:N6-adenosine-specific RNA methylase IME4